MEMLKKELDYHKNSWRSPKGSRSPVSKRADDKPGNEHSGKQDANVSPKSPATEEEKLGVVVSVKSADSQGNDVKPVTRATLV